MKPRKTWVLVADGARARILENAGNGTGLKPAMGYDFAKSHAATHEAMADKAGRSASPGSGSHHAVEPKTDWHTFEKHLFAKELAEVLKVALDKAAFDDLVLVAPPKALGELRAALDGRVKDHVCAELCKDLTHLTVHEMHDHLGSAVRL